MNWLIIGNGGREHALAWKIAQSPQIKHVYVAPGNAGTAQESRVTNVPIKADAIDKLLAFANEQQIDLTIVGPEGPLVQGIVDKFQTAGLACLGPTQAAAQLEGSKSFAKDFLQRHHIPTAAYRIFTEIDQAVSYLCNHALPVVVKADGLAGGKGVIIAHDLAMAKTAVADMLQAQRFGAAGSRVVIEDFLDGEEVSFIVLVDGTHVLPLASSQDHKTLCEGDTGPNTGGMGAYSPAPILTPALHDKVMQQIIMPTVLGMALEGRPYRGFLYAGLMIGSDQIPRVLEFNCRCGDPETQPILMRLRTDLVALCQATMNGKLDELSASWDPRAALSVVLTAPGYPQHPVTGQVIDKLPQAILPEYLKVFHAGTNLQGSSVITNGGRVLCATALGANVTEAQTQAYTLAASIRWPEAYYRKDIGYRAVARENAIVQ